MNFIEQEIPGVFIIEPKVNTDPRGYFMEAWKKDEFEKNIGSVEFIQDNESKSTFGVLRGLHAQSGSASQAKLVRVVQGAVLDVVVDARRSSPTFGKYVAVELSAENKRQLFVPRGLYHGFLVLSHEAIFYYKVDNPYNHPSEVALNYADPTIGIEWPVDSTELILSPKDLIAPLLNQAYTFD
ncbi:MAG TPA: dTDP-4-dehydrorhamnose 3,5-epimerase [Bacteroidales bacterium]|nr:dTDP-4-dehydrorhamnose 3,5-epimerase [Bacteroidales bacterium]